MNSSTTMKMVKTIKMKTTRATTMRTAKANKATESLKNAQRENERGHFNSKRAHIFDL
jgi:hypothetical protein